MPQNSLSAANIGMRSTKFRASLLQVAANNSTKLWIFVAAYLICQLALLFLGSTPLRVPLRIGAFAISFFLLVTVKPGRLKHPAIKVLPFIMVSFACSMLVSIDQSILAAFAQATLYLSTLAPIAWVSAIPINLRRFRAIILSLWLFNSLSALVGVLQVYYPGFFQAQLSAVIADKGAAFIGSLLITLANGTRVLRPMGLTDQPGGAAVGALNAILLGFGLLYTERHLLLRAFAVAAMVIGLFVIYLTHVRVAILMAAIGAIVMAIAFARRGEYGKMSSLLSVAAGVAVVATVWAFAVGGADTIERFATLTDTSPTDVYSQNRGQFLSEAFTVDIANYPLGAGMGRWGMISYYFGSPPQSLWAELMWQAWIFDGGVPLMVFYVVMIGFALVTSWRIGTSRDGGPIATWGAAVFAYNVAVVAATFDGPIFGTQGGMEMWFLNACLFNAWMTQKVATPTGKRLEAAEPSAAFA